MKPVHSNRPLQLTAIAFAAAVVAAPALGSSHREAPFITMQPKVDATDLYMFRSYETGRQDYVTILANYIPFQDPQGGPNFYQFDPNALYEIHIDNNGDGKEDLTLPVPLHEHLQAHGAHGRRQAGQDPADQQRPHQRRQPGHAERARDLHASTWCAATAAPAPRSSVTNATGGSATFDKPVDNIGDKTFGSPTATRPMPTSTSTTSPSRAARRRAGCSSASARSRSTSPSARSSTCST